MRALRESCRYATIAVICLTVLTTAPAGARDWPDIHEWGPGGTLNGATSPTYSLPITVLDSIRATFPPGPQRREYTRLRNEALAEWQLPFVIVKGTPTPSSDWIATPNTIELMRAEVYFGQEGIQAAAYLADTDTGAVTVSYKAGWQKWPGLYRSFLAHEIGHALGFGHPYTDDFTGSAPFRWVMGSGYHVADDERTLARRYYDVGE